jgi:CheY-like chemotaxis protein
MPHRTSSSGSHPGRILLVDGNPAGLAARKQVLEEHGHTVSIATGSADALEQFATGQFDLVVTDHRMPRMDGLGLIQKIRALAPETPIVLLSGFVDALGLDEHTTGASAVIQKSATEVQQLVRAVTRLLQPAKKAPAPEGARARRRRSAGA